MSSKTKLVVTSPLGTFTRTTGRTYTHLVVVKGYRAERLEASRLGSIEGAEKDLARYRRTLETGYSQSTRTGTAGVFDRENTAQWIADGTYAKWIAQEEATIARLTALGPITADADGWSLSDENLASPPVWAVVGWCGRIDLAVKLAAKQDSYRHVAIVALDGTVREVR